MPSCVIIGASHAGINCAFALRREGWSGDIIIYDKDPVFPYHRPPLSKAYLSNEIEIEKNILKSAESFKTENIQLRLGRTVTSMNRLQKSITLEDGTTTNYDKLILAIGARPFIPPISGIEKSDQVFVLRTANDAIKIQRAFEYSNSKRAVVIGGGYIGLETAASLKKIGGTITVIEREERLLARVSSSELSNFFQKLHTENGVEIITGQNVAAIEKEKEHSVVICSDGTRHIADLVILGTGNTREYGISRDSWIRNCKWHKGGPCLPNK